MGAGYTPGPWYVTDSSYLRIREEASDYVVATMDDGGHPELEIFDDATQTANAKLIAAAPDMEAALAKIEKRLFSFGHPNVHLDRHDVATMLDWVREARAKARGEA